MFKLRKQGAVKIVSGDEALTSESAADAARICDEALAQGQPRLVFDLHGVPLLDSKGLELLLDVQDRCGSRGGALHLAGPSPLCRDILRATQVAEQFVIFDDVLSAVGSFAQ
jgi:anti-sigma B factor antagonist